MTVAMQWFGKHASTIETVFSAWSVPRSYLEDNRRYKATSPFYQRRNNERRKKKKKKVLTLNKYMAMGSSGARCQE
jgi:hypothetical protein